MKDTERGDFVSVSKVKNLDCFRDAIREGEKFVRIYPNKKWDKGNKAL